MITNIIAEFTRFDRSHETLLRIYENKSGLRGTLLNSYKKKIESKQFYTNDIQKVKDYYGFTDENSY